MGLISLEALVDQEGARNNYTIPLYLYSAMPTDLYEPAIWAEPVEKSFVPYAHMLKAFQTQNGERSGLSKAPHVSWLSPLIAMCLMDMPGQW